MARTTSAAVEGIIETDVAISLTPFIEAANLMVTEVCVPLSYSDAVLEMIERWLAAHFYAVRDQRNASETAGRVSESKQYAVKVGLSVTVYGQQAMLFDHKGGLRAVDEGKTARPTLTWIGGKPHCESEAE